MKSQKTGIGQIFNKQFKKVIQKLDKNGSISNKEFASDIGISEALFSKYYNKPKLPETYEYISICNYFKKQIPDFNETFLVDESESMTKANSAIVKKLRANDDLASAIYDLKEYHDILSQVLSNNLTKNFLQKISNLSVDIDNDIDSLIFEWASFNKKHKKYIILSMSKYWNDNGLQSLTMKAYDDLKKVLCTFFLNSTLSTLNKIINKESETHKNLFGNKNVKDMYNFITKYYTKILSLL